MDFVEVFDKINLIDYILGLKYDLVKLSEDDKKLYKDWLEYRNNKEFAKADELRKELVEKNIL